MAKDRNEEKKTISDKIADKIAPEEDKPTTALQKKLNNNKQTQMRKRLILNADEDSDDEGNTYTNPVAK